MIFKPVVDNKRTLTNILGGVLNNLDDQRKIGRLNNAQYVWDFLRYCKRAKLLGLYFSFTSEYSRRNHRRARTSELYL